MSAYALLPKFVLGAAIGTVWCSYHLRKVNQLQRFVKMSFSGDMVFQLWWRFMASMLIGERLSAKVFTDKRVIYEHKYAVNEIRKSMRFVPNAKPHLTLQEKPNSYFQF